MEQLTIENINKVKPIVKVSVQNIKFIAQVGTVAKGWFKIENISAGDLRGRIFTTVPKLEISHTIFESNFVEIEYTFHYIHLNREQHIEGSIEIVTNGGIISIPVDILVKERVINTVQGKIQTLSQFAEFAKYNWDRALAVFTGEHFIDTFLTKGSEMINTYTHCRKNTLLDQGLEEFLIYIKQKSGINLIVKAEEKQQKLQNEIMKNKIIVEKDTWGYIKGNIRTDSNFLRVVKTDFETEDFVGNKLEVEYFADPRKMHMGENEGTIYIETYNSIIVHKVSCNKSYVTNLYLDKISYNQDDKGILTIENLSGKKMMVTIEDAQNNIVVQQSVYHITGTTQISLGFNIGTPRRIGSKGKKLTSKVCFTVTIQQGSANMTKEFIVKIASQR